MAELRFSIIIPVLNEAAEITELLQHLQGWREQAEIIVVDGGSSDGSEQLAADLCDSVVRSERGRARQMNAGALLAKGNISCSCTATRGCWQQRIIFSLGPRGRHNGGFAACVSAAPTGAFA